MQGKALVEDNILEGNLGNSQYVQEQLTVCSGNLGNSQYVQEQLTVCSGNLGNSQYVQCGNQILKAFANSLDPDETPQNVASPENKAMVAILGLTSVI
ncbi:hypothetical protein DPMN_181700, partial [Dreissena polymorpha]